MPGVRSVNRQELTSAEIIEELDQGNRVLIEGDIFGDRLRLAIREQEGTYYCDTPVKLMTFETDEDLRQCLERFRLARSPSTQQTADERVANAG